MPKGIHKLNLKWLSKIIFFKEDFIMKMKSIINRFSALIPAPVKRVAKFLFFKEVAINKKAYQVTAHMPLVTRFVMGGFMTGILNPWLLLILPLMNVKPIAFIGYLGVAIYLALLSGHVFTGIPVFVENAIQEGGINVHPVKAVKKIFSGLVEKINSFVSELVSAAKGNK